MICEFVDPTDPDFTHSAKIGGSTDADWMRRVEQAWEESQRRFGVALRIGTLEFTDRHVWVEFVPKDTSLPG